MTPAEPNPPPAFRMVSSGSGELYVAQVGELVTAEDAVWVTRTERGGSL